MDRSALKSFLHATGRLTTQAVDHIAGEFEFKDLHKGQTWLKAGRVSDEYLYLENGFIRSYLFDTEGNEITLNFYSSNEVVFEVASFFQRIPSQENFEATTDCIGWVLNFQKLNHLFHALPEFREMGRFLLVKGFINFKMRTVSLINKTAPERYQMLIEAKPEIFPYAQLKHIASYLGITDTSLSRIRKSFTLK